MTFDFFPLLFITFGPHHLHVTFELNENVYEGVRASEHLFEVKYKQWNKYERKDFNITMC